MEEHPEKTLSRRWIAAFWIGIAASYALVFLLFFNRVGGNDNDQFLVFHELQFWNARLFGMSKQWTPVMAGGLSMAADPQVPFFSLSMLLGYVLGPFHGLRVATLLYFAAGWLGAFLYSGLWTRKVDVRALAASLFIGNGFFVCRFSHGHIDTIPFLSLPLALWLLHRAAERRPRRAAGFAATCLFLGALWALVVDGAPVAIAHYAVWIALYAVALSFSIRSLLPVLALGGAAGIAFFLDAGYLWPMIEGQREFPRLTPDAFTNPLCLVWFMLLPITGKVIPAPANGHEYSVFIGPILLWLIWKYRKEIREMLPVTVARPLVVTAVIAVLLGMGSLRVLGIPKFLSPFDWLRGLPGFRSMGVTGRFWGFLSLPLSLFAAIALAGFVRDSRNTRTAKTILVVALGLQLVFQIRSLVANIGFSREYRPVPFADSFPPGGTVIEYVEVDEPLYQGAVLTPTTGVVNAYNMGDFIRPDMTCGGALIRNAFAGDEPVAFEDRLRARFFTWNHIRIEATTALPDAWRTAGAPLLLVLNQAWHGNWHPSAGHVIKLESGHLALELPGTALANGAIDLQFDDALSRRAAKVSAAAWVAWLLLTLLVLIAEGPPLAPPLRNLRAPGGS